MRCDRQPQIGCRAHRVRGGLCLLAAVWLACGAGGSLSDAAGESDFGVAESERRSRIGSERDSGLGPEIALLWPDAVAPWIGAPGAPGPGAVRAPRGRAPVAVFRRNFDLEEIPRSASFELRALRSFAVELNGEPLGEREASPSWRRWQPIDLQSALTQGENQLRIRVWNPRGPALLAVRGWAGDADLSSTAGWTIRQEGQPERAAVPADDTQRAGSAFAVPRLGDTLSAHRDSLVLVFTLCTLAAAALRHPRSRRLASHLRRGLWPGIALLWGVLFVRVAIRLPAYMGFDGPDHLAYVRHLLERGALPLAADGPMMYHPPLFYALCAALVAPFGGAEGLEADSARIVLHALPLLSGLVVVTAAHRISRSIFPGDPAMAGAAALLAALLPMNLYTAVYLSNEGLHAALASLAIWVSVELLVRPRPPLRWLLAAGTLLGLAILTKATTLILLPLVVGFAALAGIRTDRLPAPRALGRSLAVLAAAAVIAGWFYARNWLLLGQPVVGNWDLPGSADTWWQYPGFHTPSYYLHFGAALIRPFLASYESFFDGIYSTFWGDGLIGGIAVWRHRHPLWNYDAMALVYALALPATLLWMGGLGSLAARAWRGRASRWGLATGFVVAVPGLAAAVVFALTLVHPAYGMTKAFYALFAAAPLCVAGAHALVGVHRFLERRWRGLVVLYDAWAAALAVFIVTAFLG